MLVGVKLIDAKHCKTLNLLRYYDARIKILPMINIFSLFYKASKNCLVLLFIILLNGLLFIALVIALFHPAKLTWINYWAFLKAAGDGLIIFVILGALVNRLQHFKKQLN